MGGPEMKIDDRFTPYQAEFCRRVVSAFDRGRRFSLRAPVGSGKSFAVAGTVAALLQLRRVARVLVLAPMRALTTQWALLARKWDYEAVVLDARTYRLLQQDLRDGGAWPQGWYVASIDLAKREDVRRAILSQPWDLVVVDEVNQLTGQRAELVSALETSSPAPSMLFARSSVLADVALRSADETIDWTDAVAEYQAARAPEGRILHRRLAFTRTASEAALLTRVEEHARSLPGISRVRLVHQAASSLAALEPALLGAVGKGQAEVEPLLEALETVESDSKLYALLHLLSELPERAGHAVVLLTEYRDTLDYLAVTLSDRGERVFVLHGGMSAEERRMAVEQLDDEGGVLVATAAASDGASLNFVRAVVHYDLPLSRKAYAQREGRYRRFGRTDPCTVFLLEDTSGASPIEGLLLRMADKVHMVWADLGEEVALLDLLQGDP